MKAIDKAKSFLKKYRHAWVLSYFLIYMPWFVYLEKRTDVRHYMIHSPIDNHIPFIEYFIIPYLLWFIFIAVTVAYFLIKDKWGFYRLCCFFIFRYDNLPDHMYGLSKCIKFKTNCISTRQYVYRYGKSSV